MKNLNSNANYLIPTHIDNKKYDLENVHDPLASPSRHFDRSDMPCTEKAYLGDDEIWVEKVLMSTTSLQPRSFFESESTHKKTADEPPTGASRVLYLRDSFRERRKSDIRRNGRFYLEKVLRSQRKNEALKSRNNAQTSNLKSQRNSEK